MGQRMNRADRRAAGQRGHKSPKPSVQTYWNGQPTPARRVRVVVAAPPEDMPQHWLHGSGLIGKTINAVEVTYAAWPEPRYLYDEDGSGWAKVTEGHGGPRWGHRDIPVERIVVSQFPPNRRRQTPAQIRHTRPG